MTLRCQPKKRAVFSRWEKIPSHETRASPPGQSESAQARFRPPRDRKSTRLNSSHQIISYAVFCLKKKKKKKNTKTKQQQKTNNNTNNRHAIVRTESHTNYCLT